MPKKTIDYSNCCIYKIEHIKNDTLIYVGHTTNFKQRKAQHKKCCNNESNKKFNLKLYTMIRENGGFKMFKMIEVEKYLCNDRREAERRENEVMKELKTSMNTRKSFRTEEDRKQYIKKYYEENKDKPKHKDNKKQYNKEYREKNKEKEKQYHKEYRDKNKDKLKQYYQRKKT